MQKHFNVKSTNLINISQKNILFLDKMPSMFFSDMFSVLFPDYCPGCGKILPHPDSFLCVYCRNELPETTFHLHLDNPITKQLYGRCELFCATSLFYFHKDSVVQQLIHELKYKGKEQIGGWLGEWLGNKIKDTVTFKKANIVIPVPLHKAKLKKRGFNQSALFGKKLAHALQIDYADDVLVKVKSGTSQTKKNIWRRWKESQGSFKINNADKISGKNVLLVDDIITTGATVENCYRELLKAENVNVGVASMAYSFLGY